MRAGVEDDVVGVLRELEVCTATTNCTHSIYDLARAPSPSHNR
jgi:hypothetical protein